MRIPVWIVLLVAVAGALSGQSGKGTSASIRSAALPADIDQNSLNRLPVVKREQMDETGKRVYDHVAGGTGKIASPTGPASIELYSPAAAEPLRLLNEYLRKPGNLLASAERSTLGSRSQTIRLVAVALPPFAGSGVRMRRFPENS